MSQPELEREPAPAEGGEEADDALDPAFVARFGSGPLAIPAWAAEPQAALAMPDLGATAARPWAAWPRPVVTRVARHGRPRQGGGPGAGVARALALLVELALSVRPAPARPTRAVSASRGERASARAAPAPPPVDEAAAPAPPPLDEAAGPAPPPGLAAAEAARRRLAWPLAGLVLGAYLAVLGLAAAAPNLVGGATGVALVLALATLSAAVAVLYPRLAAAHVDPLVAALAERVSDRGAGQADPGDRPQGR